MNQSNKFGHKKKVSQKSQKNKPIKSPLQSTHFTMIKGPVGLHTRNKHVGRYDFDQLVASLPELKRHVIHTPNGEKSINFSDPLAVKRLNKALLNYFYNVTEWDIPEGYLCPPIPGRADYIHRLAELLTQECKVLNHHLVNALDIGVGANCIYPIVGISDYGWNYIATDIDTASIKNVDRIAASNHVLKGKIKSRLQKNSQHIFKDIIQPGEYFDITMCNPPFHRSLQEAEKGSERKLNNLKMNRTKRGSALSDKENSDQPRLNFGGQKAELWCAGGESTFIKNMANESREFADQVLWFSTLISKKENVRWMRKNLERVGATEVQVIEMSLGQKVSRFIAWTFKSQQQRQYWLELKSE